MMEGIDEAEEQKNYVGDEYQAHPPGMVDMTTDEDAIERKKVSNLECLNPIQILALVYANDYKGLKDLRVDRRDMNWREPHPRTDLDDRVTPLTLAAYLGRVRITELLIQSPLTDINKTTEENNYSPLAAACMAGNYEVVKLLADNGADVN